MNTSFDFVIFFIVLQYVCLQGIRFAYRCVIKCHTDKMSHGQNVTRTKWHTDKMSHGQNVTRTKCHTDKMSYGQNVVRTKCHMDKMSYGQNVTWTKCHTDFIIIYLLLLYHLSYYPLLNKERIIVSTPTNFNVQYKTTKICSKHTRVATRYLKTNLRSFPGEF